MATIDVRGGNPLTVTEIQFSDNLSIQGSIGSNILAVKRLSDGVTANFATKADIDNLILALQAAKKVW